MRFKIGIAGILLAFILTTSAVAHAGTDSFRNDYQVEYILPDNQKQGEVVADVRFTITITNLKAQEYVDRISLSFPDSFKISEVSASDEKGPVNPAVSAAGGKTQLTMAFNDPAYGENTKNVFHLRLKQAGLVKATGNVYEVMLPTVKDTSSYEIVVTLPPGSSKKISIAKPEPDHIEANKITWKNPKTKTIYALFGETQYYNLDLTYHLKNDKLIPVYQEIAFPPDTLYQKIYVQNINPKPDKVFRDEDGNYMARIMLKPKQKIELLFEGDLEVYAKPREELINTFRQYFHKQKSHLLNNTGHFSLSNPDATLPMKTPKEVYDYVTDTLTYNYNKINKDTVRMGADAALKSPEDAICTEFTDSFVALARHNKIYAREIEGYGFSEDQHLRPLSLVSDVLHAWPEFYNPETDLWQPVDPTWENTSGIDYFSSFDVNHITLAIHGKESDYPYPAGSYKFNNSKDVGIQASADKPTEIKKVSVAAAESTTRLTGSSQGYLAFTLRNEGNTYIWNEPVTISSSNVQVEKDTLMIGSLAPFEEQEINIPFSTSDVKQKTNAQIIIGMFGTELYKSTIIIVPYYYKIIYGIAIAILVGIVIYIAGLLLKKRYFKRS